MKYCLNPSVCRQVCDDTHLMDLKTRFGSAPAVKLENLTVSFGRRFASILVAFSDRSGELFVQPAEHCMLAVT